MPKSRNRKDHKKKSRQRTLIERNRRAKYQKEMTELLRKAQMGYLEQNQEANKNIVSVDEIGDIVGDDLKIE